MRSRLWLLTALVPFLLLPGCGGGSTPPPPPVTISVSASQPTDPVGGTDIFFATVRGSSNHAVTWQVNGVVGGDDTSGRIDTFGFYTAPPVIPTPASVTVTATAQADTTKSASTSVIISPAISPSSVSVLIQGGTQQFTATGTSGGINWSVTCVSPCDPGTIGTISGSGLYTAPDAIPDNVLTDPSLTDPLLGLTASPIAVTAALQSDPTSSGSASVYVNAGGPNVNQSGQSAPVKLGTTGGNINDITPGVACCSGTLGSLVTRNGANYILSNNHVLARSGKASNGEAIGQPGLVDNSCSPGTTVANLSQQVPLNKNGTSVTDAALAQVATNEVDPTGAIWQLGTISNGLAQPAPPASTTEAPTVGLFVAKSGRTTGLACGTIAVTIMTVPVQYENSCGSTSTFLVTYHNQVEIDSTTFSAPGDSGSLIVDANTAEPVALLFAGDSTSTIASPINTVLAALPDTAAPPNFPTFVGGAQHPVSACTGTSASAQKVAEAIRSRPRDEEITRATTAKQKHELTLMKDPAVIGVGVGAGDTPGEAVIVVFVDKEKSHAPIPATLDGVKTRVKSVGRFKAFGASCPAKHDALTDPLSLR